MAERDEWAEAEADKLHRWALLTPEEQEGDPAFANTAWSISEALRIQRVIEDRVQAHEDAERRERAFQDMPRQLDVIAAHQRQHGWALMLICFAVLYVVLLLWRVG